MQKGEEEEEFKGDEKAHLFKAQSRGDGGFISHLVSFPSVMCFDFSFSGGFVGRMFTQSFLIIHIPRVEVFKRFVSSTLSGPILALLFHWEFLFHSHTRKKNEKQKQNEIKMKKKRCKKNDEKQKHERDFDT